MSEIELNLQGRPETIDLRALRDALKHLTSTVESVATDRDIDLPITDLRVGSAKATFAVEDEVQDSLVRGLVYVQKERRRPEGWTRQTLKSLMGLSDVPRRFGLDGVELGLHGSKWTLDQELESAIRAALDEVSLSLGGIRGRLCSYSALSGRQRTARIEIDGSAKSVEIKFDKSLTKDVAANIEMEVEAWGLISRDVDSDVIVKLDLYGLKVLDDQGALLDNPDALVGLARGASLGGLSSEEWVRELRSE
ncbi:hypothetical protein [Brachybacterium massiliense]|uniref:hypothetical protein n=1 Tax=Brachybacterium massiliense TaxID=1755098 RepID=UPI00111DEA92|nr:hypothetical protein [Brachybacterium massiliense]